MNRHHPYGSGNYEGAPYRRGGSSGGPGPDRSYSHRGGPRGRGYGRGRGGYHHSGYDSNHTTNAYDQAPPQSDVNPYNNYDASLQDAFYQNGTGSYGAGPPSSQFSAPDPSDGYTQGYGTYEDGTDHNYDDGGSGIRPRRNVRRERDDKVHDSIIEERIQRERPCRTLFIRNIKYETNSEDVRRSFEEHGNIKTFFDLIATRGMVFVTYYDLRSAERARERLQGSEISGRPIDVHYSLPRDDPKQGIDREKNQQFQGFLIVTLKDSRQPIDHHEVKRKFQQFGDVKSVSPVDDRTDQCYVEYFDIRNCEDAFDRLRHQGLQDGTMDIVFAWEESEVTPTPQRREAKYEGGRDWEDGGRGFRGRWRGRGRGRGRGGHDDGWDRRDEWGRDRDRPRYDEDSRGGRGGGRGGYGADRFDSRPPYQASGYNQPTSTAAAYSQPAPSTPVTQTGGMDDRLEQARQVQQLLAALKQPQNGGAPPVPPQQAPAPVQPSLGMPTVPPSYYPPPPSSMQQPVPPYPPMPVTASNPYATMQNQITPQPGQTPNIAGLPANILALLQQTQTQQPPQQPPAPQYGMQPPPAQQLMSPPPMSSLPPGAPQPGNPGYQQLMAFLASQKRS
ncbi:hypothetical protein BKA82DRAFT_4096529 [Pisolithus tinctorius]|nr:hypothetical protein BKA82DRAFT_4096529 [Pisolithus tinctorius]